MSIELEQLRRSIAMLSPGATAVGREDALQLRHELADVQTRFDRLRAELRRLAEDEPPEGSRPGRPL